MIAGKDASCFGGAKNSWLTATVAWIFVSAQDGHLRVGRAGPSAATGRGGGVVAEKWPSPTVWARLQRS
jgi:hypothetical protein